MKIEEYKDFKKKPKDELGDIEVAIWLVKYMCYTDFFVHYLVKLYRCNPNKKKALKMFQLFCDPKSNSPYTVNLNFSGSAFQGLTQDMEAYQYSKESSKKMFLPIRILTAYERKANPTIFDPFVQQAYVPPFETQPTLNEQTPLPKLAEKLIKDLIEAGFVELKKFNL